MKKTNQSISVARRAGLLAACAAFLLAAAPAGAQLATDLTGLWVGSAKLNYVSDANPTISDLSFDLAMDGVLLETKLIEMGDTWKYSDSGANLGVAWRNAGYNDGGWKTGAAEFGYGDGDEATTNSYGASATNKHITTYFRKTFSVADPLEYENLLFRLKRDDAAVVYLNGAQIMRVNLASIYNFETPALSVVDGEDETKLVELVVPANLLATNNVVAVEIHQASRSDDDISFDFELVATAADSTRTPIVAIDSGWNYFVAQADPDPAWNAVGFDDSGWDTGLGQLGYGDGDETTLIGYGDPTNKSKTTYFRKAVNIPDPSQYSHIDFYLMRDDGAVVYLNGEEKFRSNLPPGDDTYDLAPLLAIASTNEFQYQLVRVSASNLVAGINVIAVSVHQHPNELGEISIGSPTPTSVALDMRLLVHVSSNGQVNLLKDVIQMWKDGTYATAPDGTSVVVQTAGRFVLVTDDSRISEFTGVGLRDGTPIGRRISSVGFDFEGTELPMAGVFGFGGAVVTTNVISPDFRTNPFRHKYHPDHDNLDARFVDYQREAPEVERVIWLVFSERYPADVAVPESVPPPGWGLERIGGTYSEQVRGLHKNPIQVVGFFELQRVARVGSLNDQ